MNPELRKAGKLRRMGDQARQWHAIMDKAYRPSIRYDDMIDTMKNTRRGEQLHSLGFRPSASPAPPPEMASLPVSETRVWNSTFERSFHMLICNV